MNQSLLKTDNSKQNIYILFVLLLVPLVYMKLFSASFFSWDDRDVLLSNIDVHQFNIKAFFTKHYVGNYAPITMMSFALDWMLFKGSSVLQHGSNILWHTINVYLVYRVVFLILKNTNYAVLVAIIFAFHPMQVETVAWVSAKNNMIYTCFFLLSIMYYIRYINTEKKSFFIISFFLFIVSCLSKPSAVVLPVTLFAVDYLLAHPLSKKTIIEKLPYFIVSVIIGLVAIYTRTEDKFITSDVAIPVYARIGYSGYCLVFYLLKFIAPFNLSLVYPYPENSTLWISAGYLVWIALIYLLVRLIKSKQYLILGAVGFIITNFILVIQLIPFGEVITADRYMYLPLVGFGLLLLVVLKIKLKQINYIAVALILFFGIQTFARTQIWKNSISMFTDTVKKQPSSFLVLNSLGSELTIQGKPAEAIPYLNRAIQVAPNYYKAYYNRGLALVQMRQNDKALSDFTNAINYHKQGNHAKSFVARGNVYYNMKDLSKAIKDAETALGIDANNAKANFLLGNCYDDLNDFTKAMSYYNFSIQLSPEESLFYLRRAILYGKQQQFSQCLNDLERCTSLNPNFGEAYYWKGVAKVSLKQNPCDDLKKAVKLGFSAAYQPLQNYCR